MAYDTRELFARLIQCEAGGEGEDGVYALCDRQEILLEFQWLYGSFKK